MSHSDPFLDTSTPLMPTNSVAAIITIEGRYLLQLRDANKSIWYPSHWGLFGGSIEKREGKKDALRREMLEELNIHVSVEWLSFFSKQGFDFRFANFKLTERTYYEVEFSVAAFNALTLNEGSAMRLFEGDEILSGDFRVAPYDSFVLWMHHHRNRFNKKIIAASAAGLDKD